MHTYKEDYSYMTAVLHAGQTDARKSRHNCTATQHSLHTHAGKFPKNFNFFRQFYKRISSFPGKFPKMLIFSGNLKN